MKIIEFNPSERPREKVMASTDFSTIDERDLLAVILRVGVRGCNVSDLASRLISSFGGLSALVSASWHEIVAKKIPGVGKVKAIIAQIVETYPIIALIDGTDSYQHYALDNVLVDRDYNLWYIDNGASFDYRARGLTKGWFWGRHDPQDEEHGFYAVWKYASDSFKTIVKSVSRADLRQSAARYDFVGLVKTLPSDYQRPELLDYADALNNWARGE